jgi:hypothetical protein
MATKPTPTGHSLVEAQLTDGTVVGLICPVNPSITPHLLQEMGRTGFFHTWNAQESIAIEAKRVVAFRVTKITSDI